VSVGFGFAALCSGARPTQEVGQRSASFDWRRFLGEAGSRAIHSRLSRLLWSFFSPFFELLFPSSACFLLWLSAWAQ